MKRETQTSKTNRGDGMKNYDETWTKDDKIINEQDRKFEAAVAESERRNRRLYDCDDDEEMYG